MSHHNTANSWLLHSPRQLTWVTEQLPDLGPQDLLLRTCAGVISSGTELPIYLGESCGLHAPAYPLTMLFQQSVTAAQLTATFAALADNAMRPIKVFVSDQENDHEPISCRR